MKAVAVVAPFFQANTLRYVQALTELEGVRPAVISQDPLDRLPPALRGRIAGHYRVGNCLSSHDIVQACQGLQRQLGGKLDGLLGFLEQLQVPLAEARTICDIPGMHREAGRNFRDKARMKDVLRQAGLPCARHRLVEQDLDAWDFAAEVGYPMILKPLAGLGSRGTMRVTDEADLKRALQALRPSLDRPAQAEEFVTGTEHTCETVSIGGQAVWHSSTHYLNPPLEVLENPWMQYCVLLPREQDAPELKSFWPVNRNALTALGMGTGLSHMEWFKRTRDGTPVIGEVGARPPGVHVMPMLSLAHETDMVAAWTRLMVHETWQVPERKYACGVAFFRGQGRGNRVKAVHGLGQAHDEVGKWVVDRQLPKVGQARADGYEGEGYAIVRAEDTATVKHALKRLVSVVRVELG